MDRNPVTEELVRTWNFMWWDLVWSMRRVDVIPLLMSSDCIVHGLMGGTLHGPEEYRRYHDQMFEVFPDLEVHVLQTSVEGRRAATLFVAEGTQTCEFLGVPATHKRLLMRGMAFALWKDQVMVEAWHHIDYDDALKAMAEANRSSLQ